MTNKSFHAAMIAGTHSGVGKTTWALALMALAGRKGLAVQPFKAGPDYIDPSYHHEICVPRKSRNLDAFLMPQEQMMRCFQRHVRGADFAVVEGMMGLFDGKRMGTEEASSAWIAKQLGLPVFLVLDGSGLATSAAAFVLGFQKFDPDLNLAGVLLNRVNHESHFQWLKQAIESKTGVPCLGFLPHEEFLTIPERHLGLTPAVEARGSVSKIERAAEGLASRFDWERFLALCSRPEVCLPQPEAAPPPVRCRIGVAYDAAFSFYYEDNFDFLRQAGAELVLFSPLEDKGLPCGLDLLYFGGGFPEIYAPKLAANISLLGAVRDFYRNGGSVYAECGGFIYLTEAFRDSSQKDFPLVGLIPGRIEMTERLQHFGYHEPETLAETFLFPAGVRLRSHEFHYSRWDNSEPVTPAYRIGERSEGVAAERLLASYQHLHFGFDPGLASALVDHCAKAKAHG